ncbi:hypothetical protein [Yoonia sp.]|uniref:hypothetical protein n=1 Tax=Yoonia sp. TaxID=2212373 RepID=UPI002DF980AC|nr:hypothetical protein [Yoonia sp.]
MSQRPKPPVFLQKASYRQRRVRDAAKLVPVLGAVLWAMPLAWQDDAQGATTNASALVYIFGVWIALIALTAVLSGLMRSIPQQDHKETSDE